jgi:hypothetical protein
VTLSFRAKFSEAEQSRGHNAADEIGEAGLSICRRSRSPWKEYSQRFPDCVLPRQNFARNDKRKRRATRHEIQT